MSTNIRRSSRRAAAKASITHATTMGDDNHPIMMKNTSEKTGITSTALLKTEGRFPSTDNLLDQDITNAEGTRGRVLRRQVMASSPTTTALLAEAENGKPTANTPTTTTTAGDSAGSDTMTTTSRKREATVSPDSSNSNMIAAGQGHDGNKSKKSRKNVTFDGPSTTTVAVTNTINSESDTSKQPRTAAQIAREQRSRRREVAAQQQGLDGNGLNHLALSSLSSRRGDPNIKRNNNNKKKNKSGGVNAIASNDNTTDAETSIVRVTMLTGTLILYKGARRRAVFVRRV